MCLFSQMHPSNFKSIFLFYSALFSFGFIYLIQDFSAWGKKNYTMSDCVNTDNLHIFTESSSLLNWDHAFEGT